MSRASGIPISNDELLTHAERLLGAPVGLDALALEFAESSASSVEVLVEGEQFYPPMLADIEAASSSVHINQFGFRPGVVGDVFADALIRKAKEGVPVRLVVDRNGSAPEEGAQAHYERLVSGGVEICVTRATKPRAPVGPLGSGGATRWNLSGLGHIDHRKLLVLDGRVGWVGGAGIEDHFQDGRFHDLFLRVTGPVVSQLQLVFLASFRWLGGSIPEEELEGLFPAHVEARRRPRRSSSTTLRGGTARSPSVIARMLDGAQETLDVVNPYVTDRGMINRMERAARRGVRVRLFVPENANNWACAAAQQFHHGKLLDAGVRILGYPTMLHAKAFVRDGEELLGGHVQPRGLEPEAVLRDRPAGPLARRGGPVRRAVLRPRPRRCPFRGSGSPACDRAPRRPCSPRSRPSSRAPPGAPRATASGRAGWAA